MESNEEAEKKMNKAKSFSIPQPVTLKNEPAKRKSFNVNDTVRSLDLALVRLKKSKLVNGECVTATSAPGSPAEREKSDMFMDVCPSSNYGPGIDNASLMSMNFSHYELVRNLSSSNCNSDGAFSSTTCNASINLPDSSVKNEHLERYFRSAEMWSHRYKDPGPSTLQLDLSEK